MKKIYYIGRDSSWYPLELLGKERNLVAFTNDLMAAITKETQLQFRWVETSQSALLPGLETGNYDAIFSAMSPNIINQEKYLFSKLFFATGPVLIVEQNSQISSLEEMHGRTIGMRYGTSPLVNAAREKGAKAYDITLVTYSNINQALEALLHNQIDGVITDALLAYSLTEGFYAGMLKVVTPPLLSEGERLLAPRTHSSEHLINEVDKALTKLKENGTYNALINKWGLIDAETKFWRPSQK